MQAATSIGKHINFGSSLPGLQAFFFFNANASFFVCFGQVFHLHKVYVFRIYYIYSIVRKQWVGFWATRLNRM